MAFQKLPFGYELVGLSPAPRPPRTLLGSFVLASVRPTGDGDRPGDRHPGHVEPRLSGSPGSLVVCVEYSTLLVLRPPVSTSCSARSAGADRRCGGELLQSVGVADALGR